MAKSECPVDRDGPDRCALHQVSKKRVHEGGFEEREQNVNFKAVARQDK